MTMKTLSQWVTHLPLLQTPRYWNIEVMLYSIFMMSWRLFQCSAHCLTLRPQAP